MDLAGEFMAVATHGLQPREVLSSGANYRISVCDDMKRGSGACAVLTEVDCSRDPTRGKALQREAKLLRSLGWHPCITRLLADWHEGPRLAVAVERCPGGSLDVHLTALRRLHVQMPEEAIAGMGSDIASALHHLHEHLVAHRALAPSCVFLSPRGAKLGQLGAALTLRDAQDARPGEPPGVPVAYLCPELLRGDGQGFSGDIWGLGCTLWAALSGKEPFGGVLESDVRGAILSGQLQGAGAAARAPMLETVARRCLASDPERRPTAAQLLANPLLSQRAEHIAAVAAGGTLEGPDLERVPSPGGVLAEGSGGSPVVRCLDADFTSVRAQRDCINSRSRRRPPLPAVQGDGRPRGSRGPESLAGSGVSMSVSDPSETDSAADCAEPRPCAAGAMQPQSPPQRHLFTNWRELRGTAGPVGPPTQPAEAQQPSEPPPAALRRRGEASYTRYKIARRRGRAAAISASAAAVALLAAAATAAGECERPQRRRGSSLRRRLPRAPCGAGPSEAAADSSVPAP